MGKLFLEVFNKYTPSEKYDDVLSDCEVIGKRVDRDKRMLEVDVAFPFVVDKEILYAIEDEIKDCYELNLMHICPKYQPSLFDENCVDGIIKECLRRAKVSRGFFDDYKYDYDGSALNIEVNFNNDGVELLNFANTNSVISDIIYSEYNLRVNVSITRDENSTFDYEAYSENRKEEIGHWIDIIERERELASGRAHQNEQRSSDNSNKYQINIDNIETINSLDKNEPILEIISDTVIKAGYLTFDISEPEFFCYGDDFEIKPTPISALTANCRNIVALGRVINFEAKPNKKNDKQIISFGLTDEQGSINVKAILPNEEAEPLINKISSSSYKEKRGTIKVVKYKVCLAVLGNVKKDSFDGEYTLNFTDACLIKEILRSDNESEKRVELHCHTNMSAKDATIPPEVLVNTAARFGHKAVAITDHGNVQGFPEAMLAADNLDIKVIYGMEAYYVDDTQRAVFGDDNTDLDGEFIVFDIETTGLSARYNKITEIGAVLVKNGEITETFSTFVDPEEHIPERITELTGITDEMVKGAPKTDEAVRNFLDFCGNRTLIAHNAGFDTGFIRTAAREYRFNFTNTYIDTVALSRYLNSDLKKHTLDSLQKYYKLEDFNHHRAFEDAKMLAMIFLKMVEKLKADGITDLASMNKSMEDKADPLKLKTYHMIILAKNMVGLKNLYYLISQSYLKYFRRRPRIPKTLLNEFREGLIIGSACESGELFTAIKENKTNDELKNIASFYDYLEIQPLCNNMFLVDEGIVPDVEALKDINRQIIEIGRELDKPTVATCDAHFLERHDEIYRKILMAQMGYKDHDRDTGLYFRTTEEMLLEFDYLGDELAREVVITNPNLIAEQVEKIRAIPKGQYTPNMEGAEEDLQRICWERAKEMYGDPLPDIVQERLTRELDSIISHGFAVLYMIAQKLVWYSESQGYLVGSRGSVGSSFVAHMSGISEVNPLVPHYRCPKCKHSEWITDGSIGSGFDMEDKNCPECGEKMVVDGHDIPFETFLGFYGDKSPDIDLNFSGDVQGKVHKYTEELFGHDHVFRAGTLSAVAEKTAYGYVKKYLEPPKPKKGEPESTEPPIPLNKAETERLKNGCVGVKSTTGQHPGGIIVVPKEYDVYDFTPVQHPADDPNSEIETTHFAFSYLHDTILKLDELGHDMPTKYKMLEEYSGLSVLDVPMNDKKVMSLFLNTSALGASEDEIGAKVGTFGLPEFGTRFVQNVIVATKPKSFSDLLQLSGLTHGTGVWAGNGDELIEKGICTISNLIGTRDSIMTYLIYHGVEKSMSFNIMEDVRKGKGLKPEYEEAMRAENIPDWYIDSCKKIQYMFPKAHAAAYVTSAIRLAWFKVYKPTVFYAAFFSVAPQGFDGMVVSKGRQFVRDTLNDIEERRRRKETSPVEESSIPYLQLVNEGMARGIEFLSVDLYKSHNFKFIPEGEGKIRMPFNCIPGVGDAAALNLYNFVHKDGDNETVEEIYKDDLRNAEGIGKKVVERLEECGALADVAETGQTTFDFTSGNNSDFDDELQKQREKLELSQKSNKINSDVEIYSEDNQFSFF